jgi:N-acetylmuramoyl-L-alanine amidase
MIVIDPGHGGDDTGIRETGRQEKDIALDISLVLGEILRGAERQAMLTRRVDQFLSLGERMLAGRDATTGMFVAVHLTQSPITVLTVRSYRSGGGEESAQSRYSVEARQRRNVAESRSLADAIEVVASNAYGGNVVRRGLPLPVLGVVDAPAIVVEFPVAALDSPEYDLEVMRAASVIAIGIMYHERNGQR